MERQESAPGGQPARARPTLVLLRLAGPVVAFAGFAFLLVVGVVHPERFDRFGIPLVLVFALAYAARVAALVRRMRRRVDGRTDQDPDDRDHG